LNTRQIHNLRTSRTLRKRELARIQGGKAGMTDALGKEPNKQRPGNVSKFPHRFGA
jgi:hypothetical protein